MQRDVEYSRAERSALWILAVLGFTVINGVFLYTVLFRRADLNVTRSGS